MNINYNLQQKADLIMCLLIPIITTLDIFCWLLLVVFQHVFKHGKLNPIYEVMWGGPMIPGVSFIIVAFPLLLFM